MRKLAILTWTLAAACTLTACGAAQAGHPATSTKAPVPLPVPAFTDVNSMVVALKERTSAKNSAHFTIEAPQNQSGSGDLRRDASGIALNMTMTTADGQIGFIVLGDAIYIKMPPGSEVEPGKPWVKISTTGQDPVSKVMGVLIKRMQQGADFGTSFDDMKDTGTTTRSAQEKLDGADVSHYWITVDAVKVAQSQLAKAEQDPILKAALQKVIDGDPMLKAALQKPADSGAKVTAYEEVWVNKDNLPVKLTTYAVGTNRYSASLAAIYSDWGKPVNITPPPANETTTTPTLGG